MGGRWHVELWQPDLDGMVGQFRWNAAYMGNSFCAAVIAFWRNRNAAGCVRLNYRGGKS